MLLLLPLRAVREGESTQHQFQYFLGLSAQKNHQNDHTISCPNSDQHAQADSHPIHFRARSLASKCQKDESD
jgi:hypothetical protein